MARRTCTYLLSIGFCIAAFGLELGAQDISGYQPLRWDVLAQVEFEIRMDPNADMEVEIPRFHEQVLSLDGAEVSLQGYMIPTDITGSYYVLSAYPYASCFFCGAAGPETVIDLEIKGERRFSTDELLRFCGILRVNRSDVYQLPYRLESASLCKD